MSSSRQIESIQILRGVAAISVMIYHIAGVSHRSFGTLQFFPVGSAGVDVFFVISGFVIAMSASRNADPARFVLHRFARIVPLYWLLTFAVLTVALIAPDLLHSTRASIAHLSKSLFFIPYLKADGKMRPMLFQGWTLNYEMFFYVLFATSLVVTKRPILLCCALVVGATTLPFVISLRTPAAKFYTDGIMLEFAYGMIIFYATRGAQRGFRLQAALFPFGVLAMALLGWHDVNGPARAAFRGLPAALIVVGLLPVVVSKSAVSRWARKLGDASYSLYLVHAFAVTGASVIAQKLLPHAGYIDLVVIVVISVPTTILISLLLYDRIERPATKMIIQAVPVLAMERRAGRTL